MEAPLFPALSSDQQRFIQHANQPDYVDDEILQLVLWTMNSCENYERHQNYPRANTVQDCGQNFPRDSFVQASNPCNALGITPHSPEVQLRNIDQQCMYKFRPPPRPFKKARYAWEIKNYEFTLNKMSQSMGYSNPEGSCVKENSCMDKCRKKNSSFQYHCPSQNVNSSKLSSDDNVDPHHLTCSPHNGYSSLIPTSYHAQYGALLNCSMNPQMSFLHGEKPNAYPAQISTDPDSKFIRWHTRQLCRSIFDNTVNRMLENMGFSPLTDRSPSPALHPLLVLSLSEDGGEREVEQMHQRNLETQALSVALHQKGLFPPNYHYEHIESPTNSDYDSSEDESEIGDGVLDDESAEHHQSPRPAMTPIAPQSDEINAYLSITSQHPSLAHIANKNYLPFLASQPLHYPFKGVEHCCSSPQNLCDDRNNCDSNNFFIPPRPASRESSDTMPNVASQVTLSSELKPSKENEDISQFFSKCRSRECVGGKDEDSKCKRMKVDDNENCITSPKPETLIEGKVEKRLYGNTDPSNVNTEQEIGNAAGGQNEANADTYYVRNAILLAIKQQSLAYQKA